MERFPVLGGRRLGERFGRFFTVAICVLPKHVNSPRSVRCQSPDRRGRSPQQQENLILAVQIICFKAYSRNNLGAHPDDNTWFLFFVDLPSISGKTKSASACRHMSMERAFFSPSSARGGKEPRGCGGERDLAAGPARIVVLDFLHTDLFDLHRVQFRIRVL